MIFETIQNYIQHGKVIDIGCGDGDLALKLARSNYNVVAIDKKTILIDTINEIAYNEELPLKGIVCNAAYFDYRDMYFDACVSMWLLNLMPKKDSYYVLNRMVERTQFGGYNFVGVLRQADTDNILYGWKDQELKQFYQNKAEMKILEYKEFESNWHQHPGCYHKEKHKCSFIICKKTY